MTLINHQLARKPTFRIATNMRQSDNSAFLRAFSLAPIDDLERPSLIDNLVVGRHMKQGRVGFAKHDVGQATGAFFTVGADRLHHYEFLDVWGKPTLVHNL